MYVAIVTNDEPASTNRVPIVIGPIRDIIISKINRRLPWIIRNSFVGDMIRHAVADSFYEAENTAKVRTIKLPSNFN